MTDNQICTITYPDGERCDRPAKGDGICTGHQNRRAKRGDPLTGGKLGRRRPRGTPCIIGRQEPWLDESECPSEHYSLGFCAKHYQRHAAHGSPLALLIDREHGPVCSLPDCDLPYSSGGYCRDHYSRAWLHGGNPLGGIRINAVAERLMRRTVEGPTPRRFYDAATDSYDGVPPCPCRDWTGNVMRHDVKHKYGVMSVKGKATGVHRVAYIVAYGSIPEGLDIDHLCCRTICCEPRHLEPVTDVENTRRRWLVINAIMALYEDDYIDGLSVRRHTLAWPDGNISA